MKKQKNAIEKQIMSDGLIHKNGKRYEPYSNKEVEDVDMVKMHTKKHHKKQELQNMSQ